MMMMMAMMGLMIMMMMGLMIMMMMAVTILNDQNARQATHIDKETRQERRKYGELFIFLVVL